MRQMTEGDTAFLAQCESVDDYEACVCLLLHAQIITETPELCEKTAKACGLSAGQLRQWFAEMQAWKMSKVEFSSVEFAAWCWRLISTMQRVFFSQSEEGILQYAKMFAANGVQPDRMLAILYGVRARIQTFLLRELVFALDRSELQFLTEKQKIERVMQGIDPAYWDLFNDWESKVQAARN